MGRSIFWLLTISVLWWSCTVDPCAEQASLNTEEIEIQVERLEDIMFSLDNREDVARFLRSNPVFVRAFLGAGQSIDDSLLIDNILRLSNDKYMDTLRSEAKRVFGDFSEITEQFTLAFAQFRSYYPEARIPRLQTVVTGFGQDLFVSDSLIIIGLDFFLGSSARYQPLDYPAYIQARFAPEYIVPTCILHLTKQYNQNTHMDQSLLADMIFFGKSYYMVEKILPCIDDSLIVQFSGQQLIDVTQNQDIIWGNFVQNELLYETNHFVKNKYIGERPSVPEIGEKCPGRIAAWLGWQIVRSYVQTNNPSLTDLMAKSNAPEIFRKSGYKP